MDLTHEEWPTAEDFGARAAPDTTTTTTASEFCTRAAMLMADRGQERDKPNGERSMADTVTAFNIIYNHSLTETEGWQFMSLLKKVRGANGAFRMDDYEDDVAYCALAAEAAAESNS